MTEAGLPGQEAETILLALAPAGTPKPIIDMLQREIVKAVNTPDVVQKLDAFGFSPLGTTPQEAEARIKSELDMWAKVIKDAKIQQSRPASCGVIGFTMTPLPVQRWRSAIPLRHRRASLRHPRAPSRVERP
jgi:hypothetical protein